MKLLHKDADYAVRTLIFLALQTEETYFSAAKLAKELGLPTTFTRRICTVLIKNGILETREGIKGGVRLLVKPESISLYDLMTLFRDSIDMTECTFRKKLCPNQKSCVLRKRMLVIHEKMIDEFKEITIQTLMDDIHNQSIVDIS